MAGCSGADEPTPDPCASADPPASCATGDVTVTILAPANNTIVFGDVTFEVAVLAPDGVRTVEVLSGTRVLGTTSSNRLGSYRVTFDSKTLADGPTVLTARATSNPGKQGRADVTVLINNDSAPDVMITSPMAGAAYGGQITLEAVASDAVGITGVTFVIDGTETSNLTQAPYTSHVDGRTLSDGAHELKVTVTNFAGQLKEATVGFDVDNLGPNLVLEPVSNSTVTGTAVITVSGSDPAGIAQISALGRQSPTSPLSFSYDFGPVPEGPFTVTATATDNAIVDGVPGRGNTTVSSVTLRVVAPDEAPRITVISPTPGLAYGGSLSVSASVTTTYPLAALEVELDGVAVSLTGPAPSFSAVLDTRALADGPHTLILRASDDQGNQRAQAVGFQVDNAPPVIVFNPPDGGAVSGVVALAVTATDATSIRSITCRSATGSSSPLTVNVDTTTVTWGPFQVSATAADNAIVDGQPTGNQAVASATWLAQNAGGPQITWVSPADTTLAFGGTVQVSVDAQATLGVSTVELRVDGALLRSFSAPPYSYALDTTTLSDGDHLMEARASDTVGNPSAASFTLHVDNTRPTITFGPTPAPNTTVGGSVAITVNATDRSGIEQISSGGSTSASSPLSFTLNTLTLPNGSYNLIAVASDRAVVGVGGHNVASAILRLLIYNAQNAPPTLTIVSPLAGDGVYRSAPVQATASAPSGIRRVDFSLNGVLVGADAASPYSLTVPLTGLSGSAILSVTAVSNAGPQTTASVQVALVEPPRFFSPWLAADGAGTSPAVGDVNGDGLPDFLYIAGADVYYVRNLGARTFAAPVLAERTASGSVVAADLNNDGILDYVRGSPDWGVRFGAGAGAFLPAVTFTPYGTGAESIALGDVDGDQDLDIVVGGRSLTGSAGDFSVVRQNPGPVFTPEPTLGSAGSVTAIVLADMDADGDLDVVLGRTGDTNRHVTIYRNNGAGAFGAGIDSSAVAPPLNIAVGDVDGDGAKDVVAAMKTVPAVACPSRHAIQVFLGQNDGTVAAQAQTCVAEEPDEIALADIDMDGDLDLIEAATQLFGVRAWRNTGGLFAGRERYTMATSGREIRVANILGDPAPDVVVLGDGQLYVAENQGNGAFLAMRSQEISEPAYAFAAGSLVPTVPERVDVVVATRVGTAPANLTVYRNDGSTFTQVRNLTTQITATPSSLRLGDFDGAGGLDIAVGSPGVPATSMVTAAVYFDALSGVQPPLELALQRPSGIAFGRFYPGEPERLAVIEDTSTIDVVNIFDPSGTRRAQLPVGSTPTGVAVGDLDDPEDLPDIVVANQDTNNVTFYRANGSGFASAETYSMVSGMRDIAVGELSGDSRNDVVAIGASAVGLLVGDPSFRFQPASSWPLGSSVTSALAIADYNGDGLNDVAAIGNYLVLLIARPQGGFFAGDLLPIPSQTRDVVAGDFNGDGLVDLAFVNATLPALSVLLRRP